MQPGKYFVSNTSVNSSQPNGQHLCINISEWVFRTGPLACLSLFSVMSWIRFIYFDLKFCLYAFLLPNKETVRQQESPQTKQQQYYYSSENIEIKRYFNRHFTLVYLLGITRRRHGNGRRTIYKSPELDRCLGPIPSLLL